VKKETKQITVQIIETTVLLATFIAIAFSTYFTKKSIVQQERFNTAMIRPWINGEPDKKIIIEENCIRLNLIYENYGKSPGFGVSTFSRLYHIDSLKKYENISAAYSLEASPVSAIFPGGTITSDVSKKIKGLKYPYTKEKIVKCIQEKELYLGLIIEYFDYGGKRYCYIVLLLPNNPKETKDGCICDWTFIKASQKDSLEIPKI